MRTCLQHPFGPVFDENSRVLLLGTMPSPASRARGFYYAHPQNRFWRVLADVFGEPLPPDGRDDLPVSPDRPSFPAGEAVSPVPNAPARAAFCLRHGVALWDVAASCSIEGASDASIRDARANDIAGLLARAPIERIGCTGARAASLYRRLAEPLTGRPAETLPSTSPANCAVPYERLLAAYRAFLLP